MIDTAALCLCDKKLPSVHSGSRSAATTRPHHHISDARDPLREWGGGGGVGGWVVVVVGGGALHSANSVHRRCEGSGAHALIDHRSAVGTARGTSRPRRAR